MKLVNAVQENDLSLDGPVKQLVLRCHADVILPVLNNDKYQDNDDDKNYNKKKPTGNSNVGRI